MMAKLALCAGIGVGATFASTWGLVLAGSFSGGEREWVYRPCREVEGPGLYDVMIVKALGGTHYRSFQGTLGCGTRYAAVNGDPDALVPSWAAGSLGPRASGRTGRWGISYGEVQAWGWPARALWWEREDQTVRGGFEAPRWLNASAQQIPRPKDGPILPLRPAWSGFLLNTGFYAALAMAVVVIPGTVRCAARRRAGRCLRCGYDLRGQREAGCPECGNGRSPMESPANPQR